MTLSLPEQPPIKIAQSCHSSFYSLPDSSQPERWKSVLLLLCMWRLIFVLQELPHGFIEISCVIGGNGEHVSLPESASWSFSTLSAVVLVL